MDQQRLLDLGRVEQVALALGRDLRVVGQHDRGAEHRVVGLRGEHRPGVDVLAALASSGEMKRPPATRPTTCVESSECSSAARAVEARARPRCGSRTRIVMRGPSRERIEARTAQAVEVEGHSTCSSPKRIARQLDPPRLAPGGAPRSPAGSGSRRDERGSPIGHALDLQVVERRAAAGRVDRRVDDPERRRRRVLGRARRVGVERVALVEQGVDELLEHQPSSSSATQASKDGRPGLGLALLQAVERRGLEPHPAAARVVERHHPLPVRDGELVLRRAAPRHHRDLHPARPRSRGSCPRSGRSAGSRRRAASRSTSRPRSRGRRCTARSA